MNYFVEDRNFMSKLKTFFSIDDDPGHRRTGRTTAMAIVLVQTSIETGRFVRLQDHYIDGEHTNQRHLKEELYRRCQQYVEELKKQLPGITIEKNRGGGLESIRVKLPLDWTLRQIYNKEISFPSLKKISTSYPVLETMAYNSLFPVKKLEKRKQDLKLLLL